MAEVDVTFTQPGDGGLHDVILVPPGHDADTIWRDWAGEKRILVVVGIPDAGGPETTFDTRWFSPSGEIELCGSGAVAAAKTIFDRRSSDADRIVLRGAYQNVVAESAAGKIRVRLPNFTMHACDVSPPVHQALEIEQYECSVRCPVLRTVVVQLATGFDLRALSPDFDGLRGAKEVGLEALIVTTGDRRTGTFHYRYFTPWHGLDESPVAASAIALLGPFWWRRLQKTTLVGRQQSRLAPIFRIQVNTQGTWVDADARVLAS